MLSRKLNRVKSHLKRIVCAFWRTDKRSKRLKITFKILFILTLIGTVWFHKIIVSKKTRSFTVDYNNNTFLKDDEPFRYISGSFHYFRAHPDTWQRKLRTLRAAGLNAVSTYVEWSLHNPKENVYNWEGIADLERFISLAVEEDLLVILRPGPYICAERDMGGFPYWLLRKYPFIELRTADIDYLSEIRKWYKQLLSRMVKYLYGNGGPIIMVQIENEYGSINVCNKKYRKWLRDETHKYIKDNAVLFTADGASEDMLECGIINGVLPTVNFGGSDNIQNKWNMLRKYLPKGPLVNSEFYSGWFTHWRENMARVSTDSFIGTYENILKSGANVNFYMFFGGTNFGFTAGANNGGEGKYNADITSYDYDAPMDEAGDPTDKYYKIREVTRKYLPLPSITIPAPIPKKHYGTVLLRKCCSILSKEGRKYLSSGTKYSANRDTFEKLDQNSGLVLYETKLPKMRLDPTILKINDIRDRAYIYVDQQFIGVLSREGQAHKLPIIAGLGSKLQILVESQGRINVIIPNDFKGILSDVIFGGTEIANSWNITQYPLDEYSKISNLIEKREIPLHQNYRLITKNETIMHHGPSVFYGNLEIQENEIGDTYLDTTGWGKGLIFVNGFNLGRYWPTIGPQITLYVPKQILKAGTNQVVLIEYQRASESAEISFTNVPNLDGINIKERINFLLN